MKKFILFSLLTFAVLFLAAAGGAENSISECSSITTESVSVDSSAFLPLSEEPLNGHWEFHSRVPDLSGFAGLQLRTQYQSRLHPVRFCGDCPAVCRLFRFDAVRGVGFRGAAEVLSPCPVRLTAAIEARAGPCA